MNPVSISYDGEISIIKISNPPVNAISLEVRKGLLNAVNELEKKEEVKAVIICAPDRTFLAGADIREFGKNLGGPTLSEICNKIEKLNKYVIASLHGTPLGGGLEVAMACHYRIATPNTKVGLPEVLLGILPGAGGTQRLPRLAGIETGLEMMLTGKHVPAQEAFEYGIIDKIFEDSDTIFNGINFSKELIKNNSKIKRTSENISKIKSEEDYSEIIESIRLKYKSKHKNLFSPNAIIESVEQGLKLEFYEAINNERKLFEDCLNSPQREGLIHTFFSERAVNKIPELKTAKPKDIKKVGVIGGGTMGTGISMAALNAGLSVVMVERDEELIKKSFKKIENTYQRNVDLGRITLEEKNKFLGNFIGVTELEKIADRELIIEAVFEEMDIKKEIFTKLNKICPSETILASNTSYLDINEIAKVINNPERMLGMHFFSPANIMKLLEIIVGEKTSAETVATAFSLGKKMKKIPVRSGVCDGFIGNRILSKYLVATYHMVEDGASIYDIDRVIREFGCAMGPFQVIDLAGGDIGWATRKRKAPFRSKNDRYVEIPDRVCERGWFGQKVGKGYYLYGKDVKPLTPNPEIEEICKSERERVGINPKEFSDQEILDRYITALVLEGVKILEEKIAIKPSDIDVVYNNGYGFPRWRGGPMNYADQIGLDKILSNIKNYEKENSSFWSCPKLLEQLVSEGKKFKDLN